jgi:hypothetical protein
VEDQRQHEHEQQRDRVHAEQRREGEEQVRQLERQQPHRERAWARTFRSADAWRVALELLEHGSLDLFYPGFEIDFFPYKEFERRSLTIWYEVGPNFYNYRELTVFDKLKSASRSSRWTCRCGCGSRGDRWACSAASRSSCATRIATARASSATRACGSSRASRSTCSAQYQKIKDQIGLPKGAATTEEILLRLRQLATDYSYNVSAGFSYSFGSIFNSVVNPGSGDKTNPSKQV